MHSDTQALGPGVMTSALLCLGTWDYEGKRLPTWGPGIFPLGSWRPAHDRDQAPLMAPLQFTLNFTYDILGDDGSLEGLPDLKGLLGPGIPPTRILRPCHLPMAGLARLQPCSRSQTRHSCSTLPHRPAACSPRNLRSPGLWSSHPPSLESPQALRALQC